MRKTQLASMIAALERAGLKDEFDSLVNGLTLEFQKETKQVPTKTESKNIQSRAYLQLLPKLKEFEKTHVGTAVEGKPLTKSDYAWILANVRKDPREEDAPSTTAYGVLLQCREDPLVFKDVMKHATSAEKVESGEEALPIGKTGLANLIRADFGKLIAKVEGELAHVI